MKNRRLSKKEKSIEKAILNGDYINVENRELKQVADALHARRKNAVLSIRINSEDLKSLKHKAHQYNVRYQTFIAELLHRFARD